MEAILPFNTQDRENFCNSAIEIGFDEFVAAKFVYTMQDTDLDVFQLMGSERLSLLIYGWEICDAYLRSSQTTDLESLPKNLQTIIHRLAYCSLNMWFSKEWEQNRYPLKAGLLHCLRRSKDLFAKMPVLSLLNWDYLLHFDMRPWQVPYLRRFFDNIKREDIKSAQCIEQVEEAASEEDMTNIKREGLFLSLLRLIKFFDSGYMEAVKLMSMRIIVAWNHMYARSKERSVDEQHKRAIILICHIYLMAIYELDDARGYVIDNMIYNIRFYCQSTQAPSRHNESTDELLEYTSARYIAMTCKNLHMCSDDFFESVIFDSFDESFTTLFGTVSHAYMSYVLGNMLMEMNSRNEEDFSANLEHFKRILNFYVLERERSELFMLQEISKQQKQDSSHNEPTTMRNMTDYKSKICKGNRMSNISNYEEVEEELDVKIDFDQEENELRKDPVFQNIPNNANILNYVYNVLAKRSYKGWHFAKLVLLLRIIGHELNVIEIWRYHPGLTTDFMLNLETKLARHFEDLAIIFQEHPFMEQEFWLTAFYLDPKPKYFSAVSRCGMRCKRHRNKENSTDEHVKPDRSEKSEKVPSNPNNAKFGLLSSTFDVQEIVRLANHDCPNSDYDPLYKALHSFRLPESIIKDLLTVIFLPRNKSFAWAVNWHDLRKRCKDLLKTEGRKKRLVELNMNEANDRLKYLKIDYDKYKHRPQLDYGSIEEGYGNVESYEDYDTAIDEDDNDDEDEDEEDFNDYPLESTPTKEEKPETDLADTYFIGTRRTRARTAAIIASVAMCKGDLTKPSQETKQNVEEAPPSEAQQTDTAEIASSPMEGDTEPAAIKCNLNDWLKEQTSYSNVTNGFRTFPDIWNFDAQELQKVEETSSAFFETQIVVEKFTKLQQGYFEIGNSENCKEQCENLTQPMQGDSSAATNNDNHNQPDVDEHQMDDGDDESNDSTTAFKGSQERIAYQKDDDFDTSECDAEGSSRKLVSETEHKKDEHKESPAINTDEIVLERKTCVGGNLEKASQNNSFKKMDDALNKPTELAVLATNNVIETETPEISQLKPNVEELKECALFLKEEPSFRGNEHPQNQEMSQESEKSSEDKELINECIQKQLQVSVRRLIVADVSKLRQPKVYLKRVQIEELSCEQTAKRRRIPRKVYIDSDVSSKSSGSSTQSEYSKVPVARRGGCRRLLQNKRRSSESSTESEEYKYKRRVERPSRGRGAFSARARPRGHPKNLIVTPRSASGLKMRISSLAGETSLGSDAQQQSGSTEAEQYIQISSSSTDANEFGEDKFLGSMLELVETEESIDPLSLYEEEIIVPFD